MAWSSLELKKDGQTGWLVRLYEKSVHGIREHGLPLEESEGVLSVRLPTLHEQARVMRHREPRPPGKNAPSGAIEFSD